MWVHTFLFDEYRRKEMKVNSLNTMAQRKNLHRNNKGSIGLKYRIGGNFRGMKISLKALK